MASSPVTIPAPFLDRRSPAIPPEGSPLASAGHSADGARQCARHRGRPRAGLEWSPKLAGSTKKSPETSGRDSPESTPAGEAESTFRLIQRFRGGDKQALEQLFARHLPRLQRWAKGRLPKWARDSADTQDLVQDTLLQTFSRIDVFEPAREGALQAYLRQAVMNRIRDEIRRTARRPARVELDGTEVDQARSPLEEAVGMEEIERYEAALERLRIAFP